MYSIYGKSKAVLTDNYSIETDFAGVHAGHTVVV